MCKVSLTFKVLQMEREGRYHICGFKECKSRSGEVAHACNPSAFGGHSGRITGGQEFETTLGNIVRPPSLQKMLFLGPQVLGQGRDLGLSAPGGSEGGTSEAPLRGKLGILAPPCV